ncbi:MAG TPA: hypothetical protein VIH40_13735 [Xanthobacteraceae bacterium]
MTLRTAMAALAAFLLVALANQAEARNSTVTKFCGTRYCPQSQGVTNGVVRYSKSAYHANTVIGARPAGCPSRYCGCGLSLKLFGKIRPELNLAWNWVKYFPRTTAAPDMVAARRGHVMGLISQVSGDDWLVYDANSGGGLTRIHVRRIRGYVIVNPFASRMANR